ncbi:hypothetical protein [Histidinibacterium aquaticum]|uniref:Uncharacterized protein n=1 Tax=Histidinibacterium aquaticum TaxID=2613962 RepID=A0A5J5GJB1_9RHOB|nr:hypothetical protein [Histidinibacterium aquaticum]KAA9008326.1 hypothetical protein F3S47_12625 [Histidinibacterium aquaticum]
MFTPTSMIALAKTCNKRVRHGGSREKISYVGLQNHTYANNLGFSEALQLVDNPYPQGAYGGQNYLPIYKILRADLEKKISVGENIGDALDEECAEMARIVSQEKSDELLRALRISFREILRNVFEHSGAPAAGLCAQYWPTRDVVEICISDRGMGVSKSLSEDRLHSGLSDRDAVQIALMPGVSSKARAQKKRPVAQRSEWDNSGYGLFFAHRLFGQFGWFGIASGSAAALIKNGKPAQIGKADIEGTIVSMRLNLGRIEDIEEEITRIRDLAHRVKTRLGVRGLKISSVEAFLSGETF